MSVTTLDAENLVQKLPPDLEAAHEFYVKKLPRAAEFYTDIANQSGSKNMIDNAAHLQKVCDELSAMMQRCIGNEGDNTTGDGTLWGAVGASRATIKLTGGVL